METSWDCRIGCLFWLDSRQIHFFIPRISAFENPYLNRPKKLRYFVHRLFPIITAYHNSDLQSSMLGDGILVRRPRFDGDAPSLA